jgi:hypothetical protein
MAEETIEADFDKPEKNERMKKWKYSSLTSEEYRIWY